ncbi:MAG: ABC transporter ATP-binding protein [Erysipelotrichaceae bacterium]|nr:ABC transporter ATP-binding protein [Erysipelotrichaceae bacterium]
MNNTQISRRSGLKIMASLITLLGSLAYIMLLAVINGSLGFICAMGVTVMGSFGIAKALGENIAASYTTIIVLCVGFGLLRGILRYFEQYSNHYIAFKLLATLRDKIFNALRILCPAKLESKQKGSIISMITSDIETLEVFYAHTISPICISVLVSCFVVVFVGLVSSWYLSLVAIIGYIAVGIVIPMISSKRLKQSGVNYRNEFSNFNAYFLDSIKGIKDIVINNGAVDREKEVNKKSDSLIEETKKMKKDIGIAQANTEISISIFTLISLITGIVLIKYNALTIGKMIIGIVSVSGSFGPVIAISQLPGNLTQTFASGDRVLNLLEEKPQVEVVKNRQNLDFEKLEVNNLSFSYDEQAVLENVSMVANKGEIVGIVGKSGSGKSTLLKLLLRFWNVRNGSILYNNIGIDEINTDSLLSNVTMVSQVTYLFDETIEDNLKIANPSASKEQIIEACKMASIHDFIMSLDEGYETRVGTLGEKLSAGEKQRIGLARAFLRGANVILLDEPTSNVDSINEGIILSALKKQKHNKTIILVSHRESTMAIADRIYKIDEGVMHEVVA